MFLLGRHAIVGQEPPIYLRSTTATRLPSPANVHAAMVEPVPPPRITRSNSSGCNLRTWADGAVSVPFMRLFLSEAFSERQAQSLLVKPVRQPKGRLSGAILQLLRFAEKDRAHHGFNPGCHLFGGDAVGGLKPAARGSKYGPGRGGRQHSRIDTR